VDVATLIQLIQGILAGMSILATSVGLLYLASMGGVGIQFEVDNTVVEISADRPTPMVAPTAQPEATPTQEADPAEAESAVVAVDEAALLELTLAPEVPASVALDYYNLIAPDLSMALVSLGRLSILLENPRIEEDGWRQDVTQLIDVLDRSHEQLANVSPPLEAAALHAFLIGSTGRCVGVTASLDGALDGIPPTLLTVIGKTLNRCTNETKSVVQQIY
jgi:hypothetical protein